MSQEKDRIRIALIGPVLPFRGGIAQHTTMLHRAMVALVDHLTISFRRQYPAWLFPGESDKDPAYANHKETGVEYLIDSMNPLTWRKTIKRVLDFQVDTVVIPWWTIFWAPCFGYLAAAFKRKKIQVVFLCHNVVEHESAVWKSYFTRLALSPGTRFIVHTQEDKKNLVHILPGVEVRVHPHPVYEQFPRAKGVLPRRRKLELLFYGFVRPYKGLDYLIEAMGLLQNEDVQLTVAGEFWQGEEEIRARIEKLGVLNQVELRAHYHTDQETAELFDRADIVVLPYLSATGSGVISLAYHYDKPVIVTKVGGLPDVVYNSKTGWIVDPRNPEALADVIRFSNRDVAQAMKPAIQELKKSMSWESMVKSFLNSA